MLFTLMGYQKVAVREILTTLGYAKEDWHRRQRRTAFALSSTTGSGKTVIAAAAIEALLHGSDEFEVDSDPSAVVLWVSKDPALNEQTKSRFRQCADKIPSSDLVLLDKNYSGAALESGKVYFINPDKLREGADFVKHSNFRSVTFWEIVKNTIEDPTKTLYMVLDEAHEGMRKPTNAEQTIVQKMINGNGVNPAMPVVWGISATVRRFDEAMTKASAFTKEKNIIIDPKDVQDSGLLKNAITLDIPDEKGDFSTTMVRDATLDFVDVSDQWAKYCEQQAIEPVVPLMVVQIPNKVAGDKDSEKGRRDEDALIHRYLETIRKHWPDMPADCVAHVLGDRGAIEVGAYTIPKVPPQDVQHDYHIRVLLAKDAVSTGWDCPRAEVLVSLRPGKNDTYVTQLLGRMVRTPLAQQTSVERLNEASCYLPYFNKDDATRIAEEIMGEREPRVGERGAAVAKVMLKPVSLRRNPSVPDEVFTLIEGLPSFAKPAAVPRPVKRILKAAQALAQDELVPGADKIAHETMFAVLDGIAAEHESAIEEQAKLIMTADIRRIVVERGKGATVDFTVTRDADGSTVDDALRHLNKLITKSVVNGYLGRNITVAINEATERGDGPWDVDITYIRAKVAALALADLGVQSGVEDAADALTRTWLATKVKAIAALPDSRHPTYVAIQEMAREPEPTAIEIKPDDRVDSVDTERNALPIETKHLLSTADGDYPLDAKVAKNRWERATLRHEQGLGTLKGWYRNPSAAGKNSLRIPHKAGDSWKSVQPDFIFVHLVDGALLPSIIDPHSVHQGDSAPKLKALAEYADEYGERFDRIVAVGVEKDSVLYGIDMKNSKVRRAVYESAADSDSMKYLFETHGVRFASIPESFGG
ncbi:MULTISPECIES: DEAD/DEAH box helicase family protein [Bacteria]